LQISVKQCLIKIYGAKIWNEILDEIKQSLSESSLKEAEICIIVVLRLCCFLL